MSTPESSNAASSGETPQRGAADLRISKAAQDAGTELKDMIQRNREGYDYCLLPGVVQRAIDAETVRITADWQARKEEAESFLKAIGVLEGQRDALSEKLSETQAALESKNSLLTGTEGERDDARDEMAALQAQLDEARRDLGDLQGAHELTVQELHAVGRERDAAKCQIVALRLAAFKATKSHFYGEMVSLLEAELAHTAKDYEGLRVVNPDQLLQELVVALYNSGRDQSGAPCISVIWDGCSGEARDKDALRLVIAPVIGSKNSYYSNAYFAAQSAKLSEAEKDTRRLDFLETGYSKFSIIDRLSGRPTRASIDAAIAKGGSA